MVTGGVETEDYSCSGGGLDAEALGADRNSAIGGDFDRSANTPDKMPPWAARDGAKG